MYKGVANSPETTITNNINETDTIIYVLDETRVPAELPNLMVLGTGVGAETVKVLSIAGNAVTVERGFQGVPKAWNAGTIIARNFTEYDYNALVENMKNVDTRVGPLTGLLARIKTSIVNAINGLQQDVDEHKAEKATQDKAGHIKLSDIPSPPVTSVAGRTGAVTLDKTDVGLSNVDNVKQLPISGGTMTGNLIANTGTDYTTKRIRNIRFKTGGDFTTSELAVGEIGFIY